MRKEGWWDRPRQQQADLAPFKEFDKLCTLPRRYFQGTQAQLLCETSSVEGRSHTIEIGAI